MKLSTYFILALSIISPYVFSMDTTFTYSAQYNPEAKQKKATVDPEEIETYLNQENQDSEINNNLLTRLNNDISAINTEDTTWRTKDNIVSQVAHKYPNLYSEKHRVFNDYINSPYYHYCSIDTTSIANTLEYPDLAYYNALENERFHETLQNLKISKAILDYKYYSKPFFEQMQFADQETAQSTLIDKEINSLIANRNAFTRSTVPSKYAQKLIALRSNWHIQPERPHSLELLRKKYTPSKNE